MEFIELGMIIRARRKALKITQPRLAELAQVNINSVLRLEKGMANPTLDVLQKITDILGLELKLEVRKKA
ncbi:MAG TPA: helix-turn-helix domain-containing protein [Cyclobacteriaceae bacterium]|nr:helix-turn-helix domain-containing protein [Cyclobacteriaceae bacterium]